LPLFLPNDWQVNSKEGKGNFCLYQGDLSVPANEKAALWLIKEVFAGLEIPLIIAGKNPSSKLQSTVEKQQIISLVANPSSNEMDSLIANAQMNILPSFSSSGIKLKLLNALFHGRHCLVNNDTISGSGLDGLCHIANEPIGLKSLIKELYHQQFSSNEIEKRKVVLESMFNNETNAKQMLKAIWPPQ
jgi:glycosyltransferase involved in cell wall biosynthesis